MKNFYSNDKSGKKKKYHYMITYHPQITKDILDWAKIHGLYGLSFDELSYLKFHNLESVPSDQNGFKPFHGWSKGYNKNGKIKKLEEKFIENDLLKFKVSLTTEQLEGQKKCGMISQIIQNNYILSEKIDQLYDNAIPRRQKVDMFLNDIVEIPKCEICKKTCLSRLTHREFRKTCSEKCRRELEASFKSYVLDIGGEKIKVQGYERYVLPTLIEQYGRSDLKIGFENNPIEYTMDGKLKNYYPDIFVKSENKIIEVKSTRTFELDRKKNLCKRDGCISKGYNFNFYIWHKGKIKII
jgi:hypothetical protein